MNRISGVGVCFVVLAFLVGCSGGGNVLPESRVSLPPPVQAAKADVFAPGDSLELFVEEDPSFNSIYPVREGGYILIPRIGRVQISGLNREEAERQLTQTLQRGQLIKAKVLVEHLKRGGAGGQGGQGAMAGVPKVSIFITGSVAKPGSHSFPLVNGRPMGIYEALLISGGVSRFGSLGKVEVLRVGPSARRVRSVVDLRPIREGKADDPPLSEGDIVVVSERVFGF